MSKCRLYRRDTYVDCETRLLDLSVRAEGGRQTHANCQANVKGKNKKKTNRKTKLHPDAELLSKLFMEDMAENPAHTHWVVVE